MQDWTGKNLLLVGREIYKMENENGGGGCKYCGSVPRCQGTFHNADRQPTADSDLRAPLHGRWNKFIVSHQIFAAAA